LLSIKEVIQSSSAARISPPKFDQLQSFEEKTSGPAGGYPTNSTQVQLLLHHEMARIGVDNLYAQFLCVIFFATYHTIIYQMFQEASKSTRSDCQIVRETPIPFTGPREKEPMSSKPVSTTPIPSIHPQKHEHKSFKRESTVKFASKQPRKFTQRASIFHNASISWIKFCVVADFQPDNMSSIQKVLVSIRQNIGEHAHVHADIIDTSDPNASEHDHLASVFPEFHFQRLKNQTRPDCLLSRPALDADCQAEQQTLRIANALGQCAATAASSWIILLDGGSELCDRALDQIITLLLFMDAPERDWRAARFSPRGDAIAVRSQLAAQLSAWLARRESPSPSPSNTSDQPAAWPAGRTYLYPGSLFRRAVGAGPPDALARAAAALAPPHADASAAEPLAAAVSCAAASLQAAAAPFLEVDLDFPALQPQPFVESPQLPQLPQPEQSPPLDQSAQFEQSRQLERLRQMAGDTAAQQQGPGPARDGAVEQPPRALTEPLVLFLDLLGRRRPAATPPTPAAAYPADSGG
jgi:hypothetical protein